MQIPPDYLLVFHGSHDPRPQLAVDQLAAVFADRIRHGHTFWSIANHSDSVSGAPPQLAADQSIQDDALAASVDHPLIGTAALECHELPLHTQIKQFWAYCQSRSNEPAGDPHKASRRLIVLPLFLLAGVHVMDDIPAAVALATDALPSTATIEVRPHLGAHPGLHRLVMEQMAAHPVEAWILLAHGSRRTQANQPIESLAERLGAATAYWFTPPNLESRVQEFCQLGIKKIGILPYFLFPGDTTDAIAVAVDRLAQQFPMLEFQLTAPLNSGSELTDLLVDLAQDRG